MSISVWQICRLFFMLSQRSSLPQHKEGTHMPIQLATRSVARLNIAFMLFVTVVFVTPAISAAYFGFGFHTAMSASMEPHIKPGDLMVSTVTSIKHVKVGEVLLLLNKETMQMESHRLFKIETTDEDEDDLLVTTKGDANAVPDPVQNIHGAAPVRRVATIVPKVGYLLDALSSKIVKTIGAILLILINAFFIIKFRRREILIVSKTPEEQKLYDDEIASQVAVLVKQQMEQILESHPSTSTSTKIATSNKPQPERTKHYVA